MWNIVHHYYAGTKNVDWSNTAHGRAHLDLECDLTRAVPLRSSTFDTIILSDVLEHIPNPEHLWAEMSRLLRADGKVILNTPFYYWIHEEPHDYYRYTEFALRRLAESAGFRVLRLEALGGALEVLTDLVAKNLLELPWGGGQCSAAAQYVSLRFSRTAVGARILRRTSAKFPLAYFMVAAKPS